MKEYVKHTLTHYLKYDLRKVMLFNRINRNESNIFLNFEHFFNTLIHSANDNIRKQWFKLDELNRVMVLENIYHDDLKPLESFFDFSGMQLIKYINNFYQEGLNEGIDLKDHMFYFNQNNNELWIIDMDIEFDVLLNHPCDEIKRIGNKYYQLKSIMNDDCSTNLYKNVIDSLTKENIKLSHLGIFHSLDEFYEFHLKWLGYENDDIKIKKEELKKYYQFDWKVKTILKDNPMGIGIDYISKMFSTNLIDLYDLYKKEPETKNIMFITSFKTSPIILIDKLFLLWIDLIKENLEIKSWQYWNLNQINEWYIQQIKNNERNKDE